jgi:hypothetical protein
MTTMVVKPATLTDEQRAEYFRLKDEVQSLIRAGLEAYQKAGEKLLRIREARLYREEFDTWDAFCRDAYGFSKTYANQLILAWNVVRDLAQQMETVLPDNERVARQLAKYPKDMQKQIWMRARQIATRKQLKYPTYKMVRDAAGEMLPAHPKVQEAWFGELKETLEKVRRMLTISINAEALSVRQLRELAKSLVEIERRVQALADTIGQAMSEKGTSETERKDAFSDKRRLGRQDPRGYG